MTSAEIVHEFQAYSHLGEKGGGGGTLIFSYIRRPGPFLGLTFWCFVMTPKDIHKIFIPQKIFIFVKTLKGIEIQNFEPQNGASPRMNENIMVPPPPSTLSTLSSQTEAGAGGVQRKNSDKGVFCWFFLQLYFFTVQKGRNIYRGGGVQLFIIYYYFFFFFFFLGGGCKSLFL